MASEKVLRDDSEGGIVTLTLNRPERLNAMDEGMGDALKGHVEDIKADSRVRVVILQGSGRAFSAGGDLGMLKAFADLSEEEATVTMLSFYRRYLSIREVPVPVIAAIGGHAVGAGVCLSLGADIRIAKNNAKLALNFVKLGLHPGCGATWFLPRVVGYPKAQELLITGRTLRGSEAAELGLVHEAIPEGEFDARVRALAEDISTRGPLALRQLKAGFRRQDDEQYLSSTLAYEARSQAACYRTKDFLEGVSAAQERRTPEFSFQ